MDADLNSNFEPFRSSLAQSSQSRPDLSPILNELPEEHLDDVDSAYSSSPEDSTQSLSPSVFDYRFEHGRRYHALHHGAYWVCNFSFSNMGPSMKFIPNLLCLGPE
jgi:hypothetical protein